jgi:O-antigen ligase
MAKSIVMKVFYLLYLLFFVGLLFPILSSTLILILIVIVFTLTNNRITNTAVFLIANNIFGIYLNKIGVPYVINIGFYGILLYFIFNNSQFKITSTLSKLFPLIAFLAFLFLSLFSAPIFAVSLNKYVLIVIAFFVNLIIFYILFHNSNQIQYLHLALSIVLLVLFNLNYSIDLLGYPRLVTIQDYFGHFRTSQGIFIYDNSLDFVINYQALGFFLNLGLIFTVLSDETKFNKLILYLLILVLLIYIGSRQNILVHIIIPFVIILYRNFNIRSVLLFIFSLTVIQLIIIPVVINYFNTDLFFVLSDDVGVLEATGRDEFASKAVDYILDFPFLGIGLGGFEFDGKFGVYPHNLFLEILSELGFFGFFVFLWSFVAYKFNLKRKNLLIYKVDELFFMLLTLLLTTSMVSGGLDLNIRIFSLLYLPILMTNRDSLLHKI